MRTLSPLVAMAALTALHASGPDAEAVRKSVIEERHWKRERQNAQPRAFQSGPRRRRCGPRSRRHK